MSDSIVFGLRIEEDIKAQYILDDIADQLEDDGFDEDDWDFLAWELHGIVYVVIHGSYLLRASLLKIEYVDRIEPVLEVTTTIRNNKSRWLYPARKVKGVPIIDTATKRLDEWIRGQFPQDQDDQKAINTILSRSSGNAESAKPISRRRGGAAAAPVKKENLNALKSLISQGKSEDGEEFEVFSFKDAAPTG